MTTLEVERMHIMDGVLSTPVMIAANVGAAAGVVGSLRRISYELVPRVGVLAAVFFLASFIHVNIFFSSVHLLLNGLLGLLLGVAALPALAVALFLQAVLFGMGGLTSLGGNIIIMGLPAVAVGVLFSDRCRHAGTEKEAMGWGALAGGVSVLLTCLLFALLMHVSDPGAYAVAVKALVLAHIPVVLIDAAVAGSAAAFLHRVRPDLLDAAAASRRTGGKQ